MYKHSHQHRFQAARLGTALAALAASTTAWAHPGHGADLWHSHGDMAFGVGALAILALGAGLVVTGRGRAAEAGSALMRQWGWRIAAAGVAAGLALVLLHG